MQPAVPPAGSNQINDLGERRSLAFSEARLRGAATFPGTPPPPGFGPRGDRCAGGAGWATRSRSGRRRSTWRARATGRRGSGRRAPRRSARRAGLRRTPSRSRRYRAARRWRSAREPLRLW